MKKIAVVYWSGTGNTEAMAVAVGNGAKDAGAEVCLLTPDTFAPAMVEDFSAIAFGCPAMGDEVLEEGEFEPMFTACLPRLEGKPIALFGSYGWGSGDWMEAWEKTCREAGAVLSNQSVICQEFPDDEALSACRSLGAALA